MAWMSSPSAWSYARAAKEVALLRLRTQVFYFSTDLRRLKRSWTLSWRATKQRFMHPEKAKPKCCHCGREANGRGYVYMAHPKTGEMLAVVLCHPRMKPRGQQPNVEPLDCYRLVTVWGHELGLPRRSSELAALIQSGEWQDILDHLHERIGGDSTRDEGPRTTTMDDRPSPQPDRP